MLWMIFCRIRFCHRKLIESKGFTQTKMSQGQLAMEEGYADSAVDIPDNPLPVHMTSLPSSTSPPPYPTLSRADSLTPAGVSVVPSLERPSTTVEVSVDQDIPDMATETTLTPSYGVCAACQCQSSSHRYINVHLVHKAKSSCVDGDENEEDRKGHVQVI
ncbi:uncharacterized protein LOC135197207 isoform X2 [Macrobrachium nipponense]|uniref:uncharacterized protein LOC135197207 isoform X2 n=1 Tax=Macrobrachium nipponense TaxID=159736 RepID=UPI0030C8ABDA